jgi:hypothetical protein
MVKAVHMDSLELSNFLKAYASGKLVLPKEAETETDTIMEGCVDEA